MSSPARARTVPFQPSSYAATLFRKVAACTDASAFEALRAEVDRCNVAAMFDLAAELCKLEPEGATGARALCAAPGALLELCSARLLANAPQWEARARQLLWALEAEFAAQSALRDSGDAWLAVFDTALTTADLWMRQRPLLTAALSSATVALIADFLAPIQRGLQSSIRELTDTNAEQARVIADLQDTVDFLQRERRALLHQPQPSYVRHPEPQPQPQPQPQQQSPQYSAVLLTMERALYGGQPMPRGAASHHALPSLESLGVLGLSYDEDGRGLEVSTSSASSSPSDGELQSADSQDDDSSSGSRSPHTPTHFAFPLPPIGPTRTAAVAGYSPFPPLPGPASDSYPALPFALPFPACLMGVPAMQQPTKRRRQDARDW